MSSCLDRTLGRAQDTRPEKQDVIIAVCCLSASSADCANTRFLNVCILCVASGRVYASPEKSLTFRTDALLTRVDLIRDTRSSPVHSSPGPVAWRQSQISEGIETALSTSQRHAYGLHAHWASTSKGAATGRRAAALLEESSRQSIHQPSHPSPRPQVKIS